MRKKRLSNLRLKKDEYLDHDNLCDPRTILLTKEGDGICPECGEVGVIYRKPLLLIVTE